MALTAQQTEKSADRILGQYWTENQEGQIKIYRCDQSYCGQIVWRKEDRKDSKNPRPELRDRSVIGIRFLEGFSYNPSKDTWSGGSVYSIDNGGHYRGKMWLENQDQTLKMRGYLGIALIGRTATLQRIN